MSNEVNDLIAYGYAPGNYMSNCLRCGQNMTDVDKRCRICKTCAEKRRDAIEATKPSTAEREANKQLACTKGCGATFSEAEKLWIHEANGCSPQEDRIVTDVRTIISGLKVCVDFRRDMHAIKPLLISTLAALERLQRQDEALHRIKRTSEMSAGIMRDTQRTGAWEGAEKVARQFDRLAELAEGSKP